jgi:hypothetical protein
VAGIWEWITAKERKEAASAPPPSIDKSVSQRKADDVAQEKKAFDKKEDVEKAQKQAEGVKKDFEAWRDKQKQEAVPGGKKDEGNEQEALRQRGKDDDPSKKAEKSQSAVEEKSKKQAGAEEERKRHQRHVEAIRADAYEQIKHFSGAVHIPAFSKRT